MASGFPFLLVSLTIAAILRQNTMYNTQSDSAYLRGRIKSDVGINKG